MRMSRRSLAATAVAAVAAVAGSIPRPAAAQASDEASVAAAVDAFRQAMQANDRTRLEALCAPQLSYGHSDGHVQTREVFVADASSGKSTWKTLEFSRITNSVAGDAAVSRYTLTGEVETGDKVTPVRIDVLMVWQKQDGAWKLLARQGFKV
jgi:ketosteroid isomerase-like protein